MCLGSSAQRPGLPPTGPGDGGVESVNGRLRYARPSLRYALERGSINLETGMDPGGRPVNPEM